MTNYEFREKLIKELQGRMPDTVISPKDIKKNNGVVFSGIIIQDNSSNVAPCICTEGLYYDYQNGHKDMDGIIDSVLGLYGKIKPEGSFHVSEILDYSRARFNLSGRLVNTEKNGELLTEIPHRNFFDLSLTYFVDVTRDGDEGCASIQVTNAHMEYWGVTEDDLYRQFRESMEQNDRSRIQPVMDALAEVANCPPEAVSAVCGSMCIAPMYMLSNARKLNGAVEILNKKAMEKAVETIGDDFYILPSSMEVADMMRRGDMPDREIELMKRIETEHTIFKYRMLASTAAEVYENCNMIRFYECIYEFFQYAESIEKEYINACLRYENVIGTLYQLYMKYEYLRYSRWEDIEEMLSALVEEQKKYAETAD